MRVDASLAAISILFCSSVTAVPARAVTDYVLISQRSVAAFRCSVLAAHAKYDTEEKRLFDFALGQARILVNANRNRLLTPDDNARMEFVWPLVFRTWSFQQLNAPTDFIAGQVYESIWEETTGEIGMQVAAANLSGTSPNHTYQDVAGADFASQNCELLVPD